MKPREAWTKAIDVLWAFRQKPGIGRNDSGGPQPGRSFFQEADSIRGLAPSCANPKYEEPNTMKQGDSPLFPRALFGLPMVIQMKSDSAFDKEVQIKPAIQERDGRFRALERMASPLILRPMAFGHGNQSRAMILLLRSPQPEGITVQHRAIVDQFWDLTYVKGPRTRSYKKSPIPSYSATAVDVVVAFLEFAKTKERRFQNT
jgi:CRISPR/Cas system CMR-associated protein Cmr1 (group 7 of RAMP superfamily)